MMNYLNGYEKPNCKHCGLNRTPEGYDGCIGKLKGVKNACCGHGQVEMAYIQFDHKDYDKNPNKYWIGKQDVIDYIAENRINETVVDTAREVTTKNPLKTM